MQPPDHKLVAPTTSADLLQQMRLRHEEAWQRLVREYSPAIYNQARIAGLSPHDAADVTQELLAAVLISIDRFEKQRESDSFRKWLAGIARNKIRDFYRRQQRRVAEGVGGSQGHQQLLQVGVTDSSCSSPPALEAAQRVRCALALIEADFQPQTWRAFWLTAVEGRGATDIADELEMSPAAVRKAKSRVLERLREELERLDTAP